MATLDSDVEMETLSTVSKSKDDAPEKATNELPLEQTPQYIQKKLYFLLDQLKIMHAKLPEQFQSRISYDLLTELANSLANDLIFEIVKGLMEIQQVTERHLHQLRQQIECQYELELHDWLVKITDHEEQEHIKRLMRIKYDKKLLECDAKILSSLDEKVRNQQTTMQQAGVAGFYETDDPREIKIQMFLFDFILCLSRIKFQPHK